MRWPEADSRLRRVLLAAAIYLTCVSAFFAVAPRHRLLEHSPFNHFALLANAWLEGRLDLPETPPIYAQNNDFAKVGDRWYVAFPPFPALLLVPVVKVAGSPENVRDAQIFIWLAGIAPAVTFLALEKLRRSGRSDRTESQNVILALLFAFGSVYFFTAVQGTVWFGAHVVGTGVAALYMLLALDAERPILAGLMVGCGFATRTPLIYAVPLFAYEMVRVSLRERDLAIAEAGNRLERLREIWGRLDLKRALKLGVLFSLPILGVIAFTLWHNKARFGSALDFGYEHLTVAWASRMKKWGLFSYHFLSRNIAVMLSGLPWLKTGAAPFQINAHGLALWFTTPLYAYAVWPKRTSPLQIALVVTTLAIAIPGLLYQNTGWIQFGYRFSNDYAVFLFALIAISGRRMGFLFGLLAVWSIVVNAFGAITFDRGEFKRFYYQEASQKVFFQPD
jgi:hypothetical protein